MDAHGARVCVQKVICILLECCPSRRPWSLSVSSLPLCILAFSSVCLRVRGVGSPFLGLSCILSFLFLCGPFGVRRRPSSLSLSLSLYLSSVSLCRLCRCAWDSLHLPSWRPWGCLVPFSLPLTSLSSVVSSRLVLFFSFSCGLWLLCSARGSLACVACRCLSLSLSLSLVSSVLLGLIVPSSCSGLVG